MSRVTGTVKWFSDRKGFGFVQPDEGSPTTEDVFVHHTQIKSEGFRTLDEDWKVEFSIATDENGKLKAENVTAPGGGNCNGPKKPRRRRKKTAEGADGGTNGDIQRKPRDPHWHEALTEDVKSALDAKEVRRTAGTLDVASGSARIKLGTKGYTSLAHANGILAEGSFECDADGNVTFTWERALAFDGGEWKAGDTNASELPASISLADDGISKVDLDETPELLWGEGKADPKDALIANDFLMRRVVLTAKRRR